MGFVVYFRRERSGLGLIMAYENLSIALIVEGPGIFAPSETLSYDLPFSRYRSAKSPPNFGN